MERLLVVYIIVGRLVLLVARIFGMVKVEGFTAEKFIPKDGRGLIIIHRHPSMRETAIIPLLLISLGWFRVPSKYPIVTPDMHNYYNRRLFAPVRAMSIPVDRGNRGAGMSALRQMKKVLTQDGILIVAPEQGRTRKGMEFKRKTSEDGNIVFERPEDGVVDTREPIVRRFHPDIRMLAQYGDFFPVYVHSNSIWRMKIKFGQRISIPEDLPSSKIPDFLEDAMLELAEG